MPYSVCGSETSTILRAERTIGPDRRVDSGFHLRVQSALEIKFAGDANAEPFDRPIQLRQMVGNGAGNAGAVAAIVAGRCTFISNATSATVQREWPDLIERAGESDQAVPADPPIGRL